MKRIWQWFCWLFFMGPRPGPRLFFERSELEVRMEGITLGFLNESGEFVPVELAGLTPVVVYEDEEGERFEESDFIEVAELEDGTIIAAIESDEDEDDDGEEMPDEGEGGGQATMALAS